MLIFLGDGKAAKIEELTFRERKKQRKTQKVNYDLALRAKKIWEQLRKYVFTCFFPLIVIIFSIKILQVTTLCHISYDV